VALGGVRQRAVLTALLLRPNQVVPVRQLAEATWEEPPASAGSNVRTYITALRRAMDDCSRLTTGSGGYRLTVDADELDLLRFRTLKTDGERALHDGDPAAAAERLRAALDLWRGEPFADVPRTEPLQFEVVRLTEQRLAVVESYAEARLALGGSDELVADLRALVHAHPLRERLWELLMAALYRRGRQADALATYTEVRNLLDEELGIEPGPALRRLHERILRADPALDCPGAPTPDGTPELGGARPPSQLPPPVPDFTGRDAEVERLRRGLTEPGAGPGGRPAWTITGAGGTGKTSLAVYVAHQVRPDFPDGQVYVSLRGTEARPVEPASALDRLLRALGVPGAAIPAGPEERVAAYRTRLADRRVLVVLDDAADEAQVRPLLPASPGSAALVTSRKVLAGLEAVRVVPLDVLPAGDALGLLGAALGDGRVLAEPEAARAIVQSCGGLPLAVRVAAARLVGRPHWRLEQLATRLRDERRRFDELRVGDLDVRASLALSYHGLDPDHRRAFRLLALLEAPDFPAWVAAPLLDVDLTRAEDVVEALADARLVEVAGPDPAGQVRFRLHDLLRAFGRDAGAADEHRQPLRRLLDAWLELTGRANRLVPPQGLRLDHGPAPGYRHGGELAARLLGDPAGWFEAEWTSIRAAVEQAGALGFDDRAWRLAAAAAPLYDLRCRFDEWEHVHGLGLASAGRAGARRGEAILRQQLGLLRCRQNRFGEALAAFEDAKDGFEEVGDAEGAAYGWHGIGWMHEWRGRPAEALAHHQRAMAGFTASGNEHGMVEVLCSLGAIGRRSGDFGTARRHLYRAWELVRGRGDNADEMAVALELGRLDQARGDLGAAIDYLELSLARALRWNDLDFAAYVRLFLAEAHLANGSEAAARHETGRALAFFDQQQDRAGQVWAWRLLSRLATAAGDAASALGHARRAEATATELDLPQERARALGELARALAAAGRTDEAARCRREALSWFEQAGFRVEADELRRQAGPHSGAEPDTGPDGEPGRPRRAPSRPYLVSHR
jgi:DNA-binding SARP family transcriptional activator